jgi:EAL domain-containing protein (putative c-di-GMP-specific phosphodiesterase class I)
MMQDAGAAIERLNELKALGIGIAIDDFGTGYSSLRYLSSFPVDVLKIAKGFIDGVDRDSRDEAFVATIVELSRSLGVKTLAEGIESAQQAYELRRLGTELGQGFHLGRPIDWPDAQTLLCGGRVLESYALEVQSTSERREAEWWNRTLRAVTEGNAA